MADKRRDKRDSGAKGKSGKPSTSRNRDESIAESGEDNFQNPRSSGTTGLGGESKSGSSVREPGGVEGAGGNE
jgi:hypothetical protein